MNKLDYKTNKYYQWEIINFIDFLISIKMTYIPYEIWYIILQYIKIPQLQIIYV